MGNARRSRLDVRFFSILASLSLLFSSVSPFSPPEAQAQPATLNPAADDLAPLPASPTQPLTYPAPQAQDILSAPDFSPVAQSAAFTVNSTADARDAFPGNGVCETAPGNGVCTLRAAIQETNALAGADTINLPAGVYSLTMSGANEGFSATGDLDIRGNLTLSGAGATSTIIDGGGLDNVFDISGSIYGALLQVMISDMTIRNGKAYSYSRGIDSSFSTLSITNSVISNNGVGVSSFDGVLIITNSTIDGNTGLGVGNSGGSIFHPNTGTLIIADSTISNNYGGINHSYGPLTITNSVIKNNSGIGVDGHTDQTITIRDSTISNNTGSGVSLYAGQLEITDSIFSQNGGSGISAIATNVMTVTNTTISDNKGRGFLGHNANITNSTISGNGYGLSLGGTSTVIGSTVFGNSYIGIDIAGEAKINDSTISNNGGVGIYVGGSADITSSIITGNEYYGVSSGFLGMPNNGSDSINISSSTISNNGYAGVRNHEGSLTISSSTISSNHSQGITSDGTTTVTTSVISDNGSEGVAIEGQSGGTIIFNSIRNNANGGIFGNNKTSAHFNCITGHTTYSEINNLPITFGADGDGMDVSHNYWGASDGPMRWEEHLVGNLYFPFPWSYPKWFIEGSGDFVLAHKGLDAQSGVKFEPFLSSEPFNCGDPQSASVPTPPPPSSPKPDLTLDHIEVVQVFLAEKDSWNHNEPIPLIAEKPTLVRVFVKTNDANPIPLVTASLHVLDAQGQEHILSPNYDRLFITATNQPIPNGNLENSLNFRPEDAWLKGAVHMWAEVDPIKIIEESNEGNNTQSILKTFDSTKNLKIAYVPIHYDPPTCGTSDKDPSLIRTITAYEWAQKVYPLAKIDYFSWPSLNWNLPLRHDLAMPGDCAKTDQSAQNRLNFRLTLHWWLLSAVGSRPDYVFGWLPSGSVNGGMSDPNWPDRFGWGVAAHGDDNPTFGKRIFAHEIGHLLGRRHTNTGECGDRDTNTDWPYTTASIQEHGIDLLARHVMYSLITADYIADCYNVAGYQEAWTSPFTFNRIYSQALGPQSTNSATAEFQFAESATQPLAAPRPYSFVSGLVFTDDTASIDPVWVISSTETPATPATGTQYCLEAQNTSGIALTRYCFDLTFVNYETGESTNVDGFNLILPYPNGVARIVLKKGSQEIAARQVSANAPTVTVVSPNGGENWTANGIYNVTWNASDLDSDTLTYSVLYSPDGSNWIPLGANISGTQLTINAAELAGGSNAKIKVLASDGVNTSSDESNAAFTVGRKTPQVFILSPDGSLTIASGTTLWLQGYAHDLEDGTLSKDSLVWDSDLEGKLGIGNETQASLSAGQHTITLSAIDSNRNITSASITVTVEACYSLNLYTSPENSGNITTNPPPNCSADLTKYLANTTVTLTATPNAGDPFANWSGEATGSSNPVSVTMDRDRTVTANFAPCFTLTMTANPSAGGSVNTSPSSNCVGGKYTSGTSVILAASANAGYAFTNWSGDASGVANVKVVTVSGNKILTANFSPCYPLTLAVNPSSAGNVTASPLPNCEGNKYVAGTAVQLAATANTDYGFANWSGDVSGSTNPTSVTIGGNKTVTANFNPCYALTTTISPSGTGSVSLSPSNCANGKYISGTAVQLTAVGKPGYGFANWSGDASGSANPTSVAVDGNKAVTANFVVVPSVPLLSKPANNELTIDYKPALDWGDSIPLLDQYQVQIDDWSDFASPFVDQMVKPSTYTLATSLSANNTYYWRVRAFNPTGQASNWSATRSFRTAILPPVSSFPGGLSQPSGLRPLFDWGNVGGASSYNLQISTNQNFATLVLNLNVSPSAYVPTADLPKGTLLFWRVRANGTNGPSAWSRVRHFDSPNPPSVPTLLTPANNATVSNGQPTLDWSDSSPGVDHYEVQISTSATFASMLGRGQGGRTAASQYTPEVALAPGPYYWRVRAVNSGGQFSNWSSSRSFAVP